MKDRYDDIIFYEELSPERQGEVRAALDADPELAEAFVRWRMVRIAVQERIETHLPDRRMLILYAIAEAGQSSLLSADERQALERARPGIERALALHPGLEAAVARVQDDQVAFEEAWTEHFAPETAADARQARADRPPRRTSARRGAGEARWWPWGLGIVAVAVVMMAVLSIVWFAPQREAPGVITTTPDQVQRVALEDGSVVRLMAGARLVYADGATFDRHVALEDGRAFFEVASGEDPFVVKTPAARTVALGTSFGVQVSETATEVVLADGRVEVATAGALEQAVRLQPGQASRVAEGTAPTEPVTVDVMEALSWTGLFVFRDTPMDVIAERLADHYETTIEVDPALHEEAVTGTFEQDQPLADILDTIAATLDARVVSIEVGYRVEPTETS